MEPGRCVGRANYGQMTAGGWMYIGPQGIVHGTYSTLLNAARQVGHAGTDQDLDGRLFVSSGLGGMSGAQGKAVEIAGGVGIIAEVDRSRITTRHEQGWVSEVADSPAEAFPLAHDCRPRKHPRPSLYFGNIVDLLEYAVKTATSHRSAFRPDLLPRGLRRRLLPAGSHLCRTHRAAENGSCRFAELVDDR
jgi:urocanate hydratase